MVNKWTLTHRAYDFTGIDGLKKIIKEAKFAKKDEDKIKNGIKPNWGTLDRVSKIAMIHWLDI